jgi:hypothetical protein
MAKRKPAKRKPAAKRGKRGKTTAQLRTAARQRAFLAAFSRTFSLAGAARIAKVATKTVYLWLEREEFRRKYNRAANVAGHFLEQEARRRAVRGVERQVGWYQGQAGGTERVYSDALLVRLLQARMPELYRDKGVQQTYDRAELESELEALLREYARLNTSGSGGAAAGEGAG